MPFGRFSDEHPRPESTPAKTSTTLAPSGSTAKVLVDDRFDDPKSGWAERTDGVSKVGYHAPSWYHVEASLPGTQVVALSGSNFASAIVEAAAHVDKTATPDGRFRYGLVFRAAGALRKPTGAQGNSRPENFYAFVIDPRTNRWELLHEDTLPLRRLQDGPLPAGVRFTDAAKPDVLRAEMRGDQIGLLINGTQVATLDTKGYHLDGDLGFYVETQTETKAHVHFDGLKVVAA